MRMSFGKRGLTLWSIFFSTAFGPVSMAVWLTGAGALRITPAWAERRLSLAEAQGLARSYAGRLEGARSAESAAEHDLSAARARRFPALSLAHQTYFIDELQTVETFGGEIEIGSKENHQTDVRLSLPLFTGGRITRDIALRRELHQAAGWDVASEELVLAWEVRRAYFDLMVAGRIVRAAEASVRRIEIIEGDVANRFAGGVADSLDVLEAELSLRQAQRLLGERRTGRANASAALSSLTGLDASVEIVPSDTVPPPSWTAGSGASTDSISRPELLSLDHEIEAARQRVFLARADYYPSLGAFGGYSVGKPNRDFFDKTWNDFFAAGIQLTWDFNLGGEAVSGVRREQARAAALEMARKDLQDRLDLQANVAYNNVGQAFTTYRIQRDEYSIARRKFAIARDKHDAGTLSVNRLLELEEDLRSTEQNFEASTLLFYRALSDYLFAIGSDAIHGGL